MYLYTYKNTDINTWMHACINREWICVWVCIHTRVYMHERMYAAMHACMYERARVWMSCVWACAYVHMYVCMSSCRHAFVNECLYECTQAWECARTYACVQVYHPVLLQNEYTLTCFSVYSLCMLVYAPMYVLACVRACVYVYIHTHTIIYVHRNVCMCMGVCVLMPRARLCAWQRACSRADVHVYACENKHAFMHALRAWS